MKCLIICERLAKCQMRLSRGRLNCVFRSFDFTIGLISLVIKSTDRCRWSQWTKVSFFLDSSRLATTKKILCSTRSCFRRLQRLSPSRGLSCASMIRLHTTVIKRRACQWLMYNFSRSIIARNNILNIIFVYLLTTGDFNNSNEFLFIIITIIRLKEIKFKKNKINYFFFGFHGRAFLKFSNVSL